MLSRLFGKKSLEELMAEADALFAIARWGDAKLAYDRVEESARKTSPELAQRADARAAECCDRIALGRLEEARALFNGGHEDLAREELRHALETARSTEVTEQGRAFERTMEQREAVEQARPAAELSDDELMTLIAGAWEPLQAEELEGYGEPLLRAIIALERGRADEALERLNTLLSSAKEPSYLWLEIARAHFVAEDEAQGAAALRTFLSRIGPEEGGGARLVAHRELARIAHERGDVDAAVRELEAGAEALAEDPRAYLALANYLRVIGRPSDAIEVLEMCDGLFPEGRVEWPVLLELGLSCAAAGRAPRAIEALENVLAQFTARSDTDFPPLAAVQLAKLHEEAGNLTRAADLYRALTQGSDGENHAVYHSEAARLLELLGLNDEARRMRERADGLRNVSQTTE